MDMTTHTIIATSMLAISYYVGTWIGRTSERYKSIELAELTSMKLIDEMFSNGYLKVIDADNVEFHSSVLEGPVVFEFGHAKPIYKTEENEDD